jgi:hypothetical protein
VNAAFLLVATAWATGADAAPPAAAPTAAAPVAAAPIAAAPNGSCCGGGGGCGGGCGCDSCCNECCCKPSLCERIKAHFHKCSCCDTCDTCGGCGGNAYGGCCGCGYGGGHHGGCGNTCNTCNTCDTCGGCNECCCKPSLCERIKAHFHKCSCCDCCDTCGGCGGGCGNGCANGNGGAVIAPGTAVPGTMPPAGGEPIKAPKDGTPGQKLPPGKVQTSPIVPDITPATTRAIETGVNSPFELDRRYETRVDRAADYSWVTGQLFYVHADGGLWVLRYAPLSKEDAHGGSVVLARDRQMDTYREGDLVTVHGEILNEKSSIFLGGPLYRARSIQLVERGPQ